MTDVVVIADILPFFRYAVGPDSQNNPAIPCYTYREAKALFNEIKRELPWTTINLYRRRLFKGVEVMEQHKGGVMSYGESRGNVNFQSEYNRLKLKVQFDDKCEELAADVRKDDALLHEFRQIRDEDTLVLRTLDLARTRGYDDVTEDDVRTYIAQSDREALSEEELDAVSGGNCAACMCWP